MLAFSGLFLLKVANLFHTEVDLAAIVMQVEQLAHLLSGVAAERSVFATRYSYYIPMSLILFGPVTHLRYASC